jgi:hypothetical protein
MKIGVGAAVYLANQRHFEHAEETLRSITSEHELEFCLWLNHPIKAEWQVVLETFGHIHTNEENNVSRAWNRAIDHLLRDGCRYVFIPNLDIVVRQGALDALVAAAGLNAEPLLWTMANWHGLQDSPELPGLEHAPLHDNWTPYPHFSAYMVDHRLFELVGPFDENFRPAYNEDLDMHWRIRLAGGTAVQYEGSRFYHHGSRTIVLDPALMQANAVSHAELNAYFVRKWGYKPPTADDPFTDGMFKYPFNDPAQAGLERQFITTW